VLSVHYGAPTDLPGKATLSSLRPARPVVTRVWRSSARKSFDNRSPHDDTLRAVEYVPAGTVLTGTVALPQEHEATFTTLLYRCGALGKGRTRGDGRVEWACERLDEGGAQGEAEPARGVEPAGQAGRFRLLLHADEPVCLPRTGIPGNLITTEVFLRGQQVQGALAARLWQEGRQDAVSWDDVSVGDALPLPEGCDTSRLEDIEVLPAPLSVRREKPAGAASELPWWSAVSTSPACFDGFRLEPGKRTKRLGGDSFVARCGQAPWRVYTPSVQVHLRHQKSALAGGAPALFSVERIAEGTLFLCDILVPDGEAFRTAMAGTEGTFEKMVLRVGRGRAPLQVVKAQWEATTRDHAEEEEEGPFRLTLTSDLLVRDEDLCWLESLDRKAVCSLAGVQGEDGVEVEAVQMGTKVHGFNVSSGLPRAPAMAVRRGSSYRLSGEGAPRIRAALKAKAGMGERCALGFGRFRIDPDNAPPGVCEERDSTPVGCDVPPQNSALARGKKLAEAVKCGAGPSRSQWYSLRQAVLTAPDVTELGRRLDGLGRSRAGRVWNESSTSAVLQALQGQTTVEGASALCDAVVRWLFPRTRDASDATTPTRTQDHERDG
jgi:hypothetical protein